MSATLSFKAKNFAKVTVSTGYNAAATAIVLVAGQVSKLPSDGPFLLVWWDATIYGDPSDDPNHEIVSVAPGGISGDTLTVTRAREGTSATNKNTVGSTYKMVVAALAINEDVIVIKTSDATAVNNSTTLVADADLAFAIGANELWEWEMDVMWSSSTANFKWDFDGPAGATFLKLANMHDRYPVSGGLFTAVVTSYLTGVLGRLNQGGGATPNLDAFRLRGICSNGATPGTIQFKYAQFSAVVEDTILLSGTILKARRIK